MTVPVSPRVAEATMGQASQRSSLCVGDKALLRSTSRVGMSGVFYMVLLHDLGNSRVVFLYFSNIFSLRILNFGFE